MNRLKLQAKGATRVQPAEIQQKPPKDYAPGDRSTWPRSPAALKAYAISRGYALAGTRQK